MIEITNTTKLKINKKQLTNLSEAFLQTFKKSRVDVSIAIVGDLQIKRLNDKYRGHNTTTDVLSFAGAEWEGNLLGELIINPREIKRLHKYREILEFVGLKYPPVKLKSAETYLFYFILIHGLLHLIGYNDETEEDRLQMLQIGRDFLDKHGII
ncbi:MAG: rRNA maturation RNase YbeY [Candidatus Falkowbacteria bacterium]